jgi:hypothetical protein
MTIWPKGGLESRPDLARINLFNPLSVTTTLRVHPWEWPDCVARVRVIPLPYQYAFGFTGITMNTAPVSSSQLLTSATAECTG